MAGSLPVQWRAGPRCLPPEQIERAGHVHVVEAIAMGSLLEELARREAAARKTYRGDARADRAAAGDQGHRLQSNRSAYPLPAIFSI